MQQRKVNRSFNSNSAYSHMAKNASLQKEYDSYKAAGGTLPFNEWKISQNAFLVRK